MKYVIQKLAFECQPFAIANHSQLEVCICTTGEFWIIKQVKLKAINFEINCNTLDDDYFLHYISTEKKKNVVLNTDKNLTFHLLFNGTKQYQTFVFVMCSY